MARMAAVHVEIRLSFFSEGFTANWRETERTAFLSLHGMPTPVMLSLPSQLIKPQINSTRTNFKPPSIDSSMPINSAILHNPQASRHWFHTRRQPETFPIRGGGGRGHKTRAAQA